MKLSLAAGSLDTLTDGALCFRVRLVRDDEDLPGTYRLEALVPTDANGEALLREVGADSGVFDDPSPEVAAHMEQWRRLFDGDGPINVSQAERLREILEGVGLSSSQANQIIRRFNTEAADERSNA